MAFTGRKHGTQSRTFWLGLGGILGKFKFLVTEGTHNATLTVTNEVLTGDREIKFPNNSGTLVVTGGSAELTVGPVALITHTAAGTADTEIQDLVNVDGYGFKTKDEGNTVLAVVKNLQQRVLQLENKMIEMDVMNRPE